MSTIEAPVRVEQGTKRIRAYLGGEVVADTTRPLLVWEKPYYPTYYFPADDVRTELLIAAGDEGTFTVTAGGKEAVAAARHDDQLDAIRLDWRAMDAWFEEDEEVFVHARDPYTRIDALPSSRHVRVEVGGTTVAESSSPTFLFETGLPTRYYLPKTHVRMDLLTPTDTATRCPYKGEAEYWSLTAGDTSVADIAWSYPTPLPESQRIAGLVCFYPEKVDLFVDGVKQE
jgi:uncharacterized protein (DUF427 family)